MESEKPPSPSALLEEFNRESENLKLSLPTKKYLWSDIYFYDNFWCPSTQLPSVIAFQKHFQARNDDIILASFPKSGTTWLKALLYSIVNRHKYSPSNTPLLSSNPHDLVHCLEIKLYDGNKIPELETLSSPRIFSTHFPYATLPISIKHNDCRIVYICRNPFDTLVSYWMYLQQAKCDYTKPTLEEVFDSFCTGAHAYGPLWDHMLGFWNKSKEMPEKVLFLKYEELKEDTTFHIKRLAEFVGFPFSPEEEKEGTINDILQLCSIGSLRDLEVNRSGSRKFFDNKSFFRKGEVGDWVNHLNPSMVKQLNNVMMEKLSGSGLTFKVSQ